VKAWTAELKAEGLAPSYVYALHSRLSQVMSDAVHDGILARNPCSRRTSPGAGSQRPYVATTEQVWALYEAFPDDLAPAVLLGAFVGLRTAEVCGLRVSDLDFMRGVVTPAQQWPGEPLKTDASRSAVPIPQELALMLSAVVDGPMLVDAAPWAIDRAVRAVRVQAGLPDVFRFHDLRHYFASLLIASGADVKVVQARLRHASAKTTLDTYGHMWPDADESARAAVGAVLAARADSVRTEEGG
jgi:integrase